MSSELNRAKIDIPVSETLFINEKTIKRIPTIEIKEIINQLGVIMGQTFDVNHSTNGKPIVSPKARKRSLCR